MKHSLVVLSPHPDDEVLYYAGLIIKARRVGMHVKLIYMTSGRYGRTLGITTSSGLAAMRRQEALNAASILDVKDVVFLGYDDYDPKRNKLGSWRGMLAKLEVAAKDITTKSILVSFPPNGINGHPDHVRSSVIARRYVERTGVPALYVNMQKPFSYPDKAEYMPESKRQKLYTPPTHVLRLGRRDLNRKFLALSCYRTQALSVMDFIRRSEGNISLEAYSIASGRMSDFKILLDGCAI